MVDCTTAGNGEFVHTACGDFTDTVIKSCLTEYPNNRNCGTSHWWNCGNGVNECVPRKTSCSAGHRLSSEKPARADTSCVDCADCNGGYQIKNCGPGTSTGSCELVSCEAGKYMLKEFDGHGTFNPTSQCRDCTTWPATGQNNMYLVGCGTVRTKTDDGLQLGTVTTCTECAEDEYQVVGCRNEGAEPYDATQDRVCAKCDTLPACVSLDQYRSCGFGTDNGCVNCESCPDGEYRSGCNHTVYRSASEGVGGVCANCPSPEKECQAGKRITIDCPENSRLDRSYCETCSNPLPVSSIWYWSGPNTDSAGHGITDNCAWECAQGFYKRTSPDVACVPCTKSHCAEGQYRSTCQAGSQEDAVCLHCGGVTQCAQGEYIQRCSGTTGTDVAAQCVSCTEEPCTAGKTRRVCDGWGFEDAACHDCDDVPENAIQVGDCEWICVQGYYRSQESCHECSTWDSISDPCTSVTGGGVLTRALCLAGQATTDPPCECIAGYERVMVNGGGASCRECSNYEYNDEIGGNCRPCPVGYQGNGLNGVWSTTCVACPVNFFRNSSMSRCEYCESGTDGHVGMTVCNVCPHGQLSTIADVWTGFVWDITGDTCPQYQKGKWVSYSGSIDIPCHYRINSTEHTFCRNDEAINMYGLGEIRWLETADCPGCGTSTTCEPDPMSVHSLLDAQPRLPQTCDQCDTGNIFLR